MYWALPHAGSINPNSKRLEVGAMFVVCGDTEYGKSPAALMAAVLHLGLQHREEGLVGNAVSRHGAAFLAHTFTSRSFWLTFEHFALLQDMLGKKIKELPS